MINALRGLTVCVLALHWGGLTFYTGFVVPISHNILQDPMEGGLITQQTTHRLQMLCCLSVVFMTIHAIAYIRITSRLKWILIACPVVLSLCLVGEFVVHKNLDAVIDTVELEITDRDTFEKNHRRYNQLTTVEWLTVATNLCLTIAVWRNHDMQQSANTTK